MYYYFVVVILSTGSSIWGQYLVTIAAM